MSRICTLIILLTISLMLAGQSTGRVNFKYQSRCYPDVVWYGTSSGLYTAHHCARLTDRNQIQSRNNEIVIKNIIDLYEELGSSYNTFLVAIYDGQYYQTFSLDTGHVFRVSPPQAITRLAWDKIKKNGLK